MKNFFSLYFVLLACFIQPLTAQLTPQQAIEEMGRGINLGNTLEPPLEGAWNNGPAQESYFDTYLEAGFTNIRIPVRWDQHTESTAPFAVTESWMNRVEEVVDWGLSRGFYITINGHHEDWLKNNYNNVTLRDRYDAIWTQVAERFQNKSDKLLFEIINEPIGMTVSQVDDLNERILGIIRETNPTRLVIYGGNMYNNSDQLLNAAIPDDEYIIGYYHAYDPWEFSGQGNGTWGTANDYQQLTNKYQTVKNWSVANNVSIHHSEFGAIHACDYNSRMRIYAHNIEQCIAKGFAFSVWDDGGDFGVLNRGNNTWPEVKDILMHYREDSPNEIFSSVGSDPITNEPAVIVSWNNRTTENNNIILERSILGSNNFTPIVSMPPYITSYSDTNIEVGNSYTYRMYTTLSDGTLLHGYPTRVIVSSTVQAPFNNTAIEIPGELEIEEYDLGGEGLAYHDDDAANIPNGFRQDEGVDIGVLGNGYFLEYVANGEWIEYTVNVSQSGTYSVAADVASEVANGAFSITFDKNDASTDFTTPNTGSWVAIQEISANNTIELEAGEQIMRLDITNSNPFNLDKLIFTFVTSNENQIELLGDVLHLSPNPTNGILNIEVLGALSANKNQVELLTLTGEKIRIFDLESKTSTIDLGELENGLYLIRLIGGETNQVYRVQKY